MRAAVVGGGLAGLAAALELIDAGDEVTLYEARPTLGGAVQTLPERDGDPSPPPDNGQHIALGCFTEYLSFLDRIGESGSYSRRARSQSGETFGAVLRRLGASDLAVERFWDVFMRPALNLRCDEVDAEAEL
ncbi:MAG: hypothetical protein V7645_1215, partial [Actinomycetota bacterium]